MTNQFERLREILDKQSHEYIYRSKAWQAVFNVYIPELLEHLENRVSDKDLKSIDSKEIVSMMLNGAEDWSQYSWGGCSLIYDIDILEANFPKSIVKKYQNSDTIRGKHLLEWQALRLNKACWRIVYAIYNLL